MKRPLAVIGYSVFFALVLLADLPFWARTVLLCAATVLGLGFVALLLIKQKKPLDGRSREARTTYAAACFAVAAACLLSWAGQLALDEPASRYAEKTADVTAQVQEISAPRYGRYYAICKAQSVDGNKESFKFRLALRSPVPCVEGDIISARLSFFAYQNPSKRVCLGAYLPTQGEIESTPAKPGLSTWVFALRAKLLGSIDEYLPNEYGALTKGLMLGDISGLSAQTSSNFRILGISHLIAVSGQHLAIWCVAVLAPLFNVLRAKKRTQAIFISSFVLLFMALTGFSDSIVRSGLMLLLTQAGAILNRRADSLNSLGFAVLVICIASPGAAQGLGLQLSFLATLGILLGAENSTPKISAKPLSRAWSFVKDTAKCTALASVFTLPISMRASGQLGILAVPANIIFALPAGLALIASGLCAIFSLVPGLRLLSAPIAFVCGLCSKFMLDSSKLLAKIPYASINASGRGMTLWLCGSLAICALAVLIIFWRGGKERHKKQILRLCALLCAALLPCALLVDSSFLRRGSQISIANTGALSVAVTSAGHTLLVGAGGESFNAAGEIADAVTRGGGDLQVMLSSGDKTELDNLSAVLKEFPAERIYSPSDITQYLLPNVDEISATPQAENIIISDSARLLYRSGDGINAALLELEGVRVLLLFSMPSDFSLLPEEFLPAELLLCPGIPPDIPQGIGLTVVCGGTEAQARYLAQHGERAVLGNNLSIMFDGGKWSLVNEE
ncbi:MAG: ComEC/Rec2 family competence protein [Clostridium sp.]|nr:ComEC/Rec2 family competence protein [Clostridium sp.]